ncbi:2'-5' RNA ligase family protein [Candidatus Uabimicrobium amorphum]|uniref:RNA 2',3'-cyclic phosphodiesterase n=1 Tax=Uabimicrobium amorphum TaxID=2596890 RepID=A0A5S9F5D0_UABAM|nr:2'-5' RNA ligase family protein [Candidatus Uabimicrobium amorphum]BBM86706.1 RNA 2',3'-cyclic phosphodiesterase [Candidatus Uabimicrobium amorphum]
MVDKSMTTGVKGLTKILMPSQHWKTNNIHQLRFDLTVGWPPKLEAPHITLLDPIAADDRFEDMRKHLCEALKDFPVFTVKLSKFDFFRHRRRGYTLYLVPEVNPQNALRELQSAISTACTNLHFLENKISRGFNPHVSIAKIADEKTLHNTMEKLQKNWKPIEFQVQEIYIMSKLLHDTVVRHVVPFSANTTPNFSPIPFSQYGQHSININHVPLGTTKKQLLNTFQQLDALKARVTFKTTGSQKQKGWGHVIFPSKEKRDQALHHDFYIDENLLEIFPCD